MVASNKAVRVSPSPIFVIRPTRSASPDWYRRGVNPHSTNPIQRLNGENKRRTEVVGIFRNEDAIVRLIGAILLEQNDEWAVRRARYMTLETTAPLSDNPTVSLQAIAS
ncbi:Transposase, Mutator family [Bradyrhizobium sp. Ghvi]|nr:Transposase, Mutator family [Bradyrhizobium sp. Ghvi]